ncbi:TPA: methyltransferase domain-containing protein [Salmonella enterica]|uniref:SAM-dependent methyltransferase n=2 Tax=Salmonella enterica TaxID=28901 RepID=A0A3V8I996_SALER|nr:class I SAM-dependent methyltransferase [Salmonella enterica]ECC9158988.1 SAM-dependent methyltransferase [Salmonella enterica subsp. salamae]AZT26125.1 SAM-dependent methyltransferase [Salmonella enterica subsp. salamae serovar 42:r:-]AZT52281.1 SAM-dependent methyltransferase [Salmonella enterica subsp. salamae serovar 42:r:-]AZT56782.1 SAM-dependent methyltransferase [Salmonella enterica subsp. salamae serovar 42:r:-]EAA9060322.1 SAM-dependent methyltransferase [Salmonella enterica]
MMMDLSADIFATHRIRLLPDEGKIPWDEPAFSQRMLENHLSQDHDWASRRLTVIEQQVTWITRQLPAGARILDLGCGPGFYTRLLAERGFHCTGVDFSPASIKWARQRAQAADLNIDYIQQDIRTYHPTEPFDFIMMTFGELNVFSATDAQSLISHCAQWLKPGGKLLVEVHTFDEVKRQGMAQASWQRCPHGLFLAEPHLLLTENAWDEEAQTSSTQFWAIAENGGTTRFGSQMKAWRDDECISLLGDAGFTVLQRPDSHTWPVGETFAGKLFALLAEKATPSEGITLSKRNKPMDIPRIFTISESEHRIHNPFTAEKYATLGHALRMKPGTRILDLGSGSGEMLCTWARDYGVTGTGVDISQLFTTQAKQRAEELGVSEYVHFIHNDAAGYIGKEKHDVAACVGATWIAGGVAGTIDLLAKSLKPGGIILIGEPYWRQIPATEEIAHACGVSSVADFRPLPELVAFFDQLGYDVVEMVLADPQGWDRYEAAKWMTMRRWLEENPDDECAQEVRTELTVAPKRHVTWTREYFGWGVFALIAR